MGSNNDVYFPCCEVFNYFALFCWRTKAVDAFNVYRKTLQSLPESFDMLF